jgi:NAD+ diphosphatase
MRFTYCPQCGQELVLREIGDEGLIPFCKDCSKPYFDWFGQCTITAVINEYDEVALLNHVGADSTVWGLVAGHLKQGETLEHSATREVNEETGQVVDSIEFVASYYYEKKELLMAGFKCQVRKGPFNKSSEIERVEWYSFEEAKALLREGSIARQLLCEVVDELSAKAGG